MAWKPVAPGTLAALAVEWRQLMRAAQEPDISDADRSAFIEGADALLASLTEMQTTAEAVRVAEILFGSVARDDLTAPPRRPA